MALQDMKKDQDEVKENLTLLLRKFNGVSASISSGLEGMLQKSQNEFISLGSNLQNLAIRSKELSEISSSISKKASDEKIQCSMDGIWSVFNRVCNNNILTRKKAKTNLETLNKILPHIDYVSKPLKNFLTMVRMLRMVGIFIKTESTRLENTEINFSAIALDINELAEMISTLCTQIQSHADSLTSLTQENISYLNKLITSHSQLKEVILFELQNNLESMQSKQDIRSDVAKSVADLSNKVSKSIDSIIMSMQFDDITRQKFEHVIVALQEIVDKTDDVDMEYDEALKLVIWVENSFRIQSAQLQSAKDELDSAILTIIQNLEEINDGNKHVTDNMKGMTGKVGKSVSSLQVEMEKVISIIADSVSENNKGNQQLSNMVHSLTQLASAMHSFIQEIETISTNIELIAINTQVKSTHSGETGKSMGVLAEEIRTLSLKAREDTSIVADSIRKVGMIGDELKTKSDSESGVSVKGQDSLIENLKESMSSLHSINQEVQELSARLQNKEQNLVRDIKMTVSGINVHHMINSFIEKVIAEMHEIISQCTTLNIQDVTSLGDGSEFDNMKARYTMDSEFAVHVKIFNKGMSGLENNQNKAQLQEIADNEFDENVELF